MADFQQKVTGAPAEGLPGQLFDGYFVSSAMSFVSDGSLEAGSFAFMDPTKNDSVPQAQIKCTGGRLVGVVMRAFTAQLPTPSVASTNKFAAHTPVSIAARGRLYYKVPTGQTPTVGQHALVNPADGAVTFGNAGDANDSGWAVIRYAAGKNAAAAGDIVVIENLG